MTAKTTLHLACSVWGFAIAFFGSQGLLWSLAILLSSGRLFSYIYFYAASDDIMEGELVWLEWRGTGVHGNREILGSWWGIMVQRGTGTSRWDISVREWIPGLGSTLLTGLENEQRDVPVTTNKPSSSSLPCIPGSPLLPEKSTNNHSKGSASSSRGVSLLASKVRILGVQICQWSLWDNTVHGNSHVGWEAICFNTTPFHYIQMYV